MSVAVAVKKGESIALATDSLTSFGSMQLPSENLSPTKVVKCGASWIAGTGWSKYDLILRDYIGRTKRPPKLDNDIAIFRFFHTLWGDLQKRYSLVNEQADDKDSPFGDLDSSFLIVSPKGIFYVASDMSVTEFDRYFAIGSGQDYALGACHVLGSTRQSAAKVASTAAEAACAYDAYCGGEINIVEVKCKA